MKFDRGILFNGGKVRSWDLTPYPKPEVRGQGVSCASAASAIQFGDNFIKQKLQGNPCFRGGVSHFQICNLDPEGPGPPVLLEPWSINFTLIIIQAMPGTPTSFKCLLYLMMASGCSTMVKHQPHYHKVKGLCPTLGGTWREICERERQGQILRKVLSACPFSQCSLVLSSKGFSLFLLVHGKEVMQLKIIIFISFNF